MIDISKEESEKIRKQYPNAEIYRTMKGHQGKKRGKRYLPEVDCYLRIIADTNSEARQLLQEHHKNHH